MNKRILFFDIDGTLLEETTQTVPGSTLDALREAQENGHILIVNTGRTKCIIESVITSIGFDGYICGCGTYIEYQGKPIFHTTLSEQTRREVLDMIQRCNIQAIIEGVNETFITRAHTHPIIQVSYENYVNHHLPIRHLKPSETVIFDKFAACYDETSDIDLFRNFLQSDFEIIQRDKTFIEVIPRGYSKATGIQYLINHLGFQWEQTISFGDSPNDLSMLDYTKESVAMGNSNPFLFDKVTHITSNITEDGIANALKHFQLI